MIGKVRGVKVDQGNDSSTKGGDCGALVRYVRKDKSPLGTWRRSPVVVLIIKRGVNTGSNQPCTSRFKTPGHDNRLLKGDSTLLRTSMPTESC